LNRVTGHGSVAGTQGRWRLAARLPAQVGACFAIAAASLALPSAPDKDPWSWLVWGRELAHLQLDTSSGSSWKPLPVLLTAPLSVFGDIAPELWLVVSRAGGLLAVLFAYRIAARLAVPVAGVVAGLCLAGAGWTRLLAHGNVEPLCAGLVLGAVDRHLAGRPQQAIALGAVAALGRIELWPLLVLYALFVLLRHEARRVVVVVLVVLVPVLWLGGDWAGSGDPFHGSREAAGFQVRLGERQGRSETVKTRVRRVVTGAADILIPPALVAALVGIAFAIRSRDRTALALAAAAGALITLVIAMSLRGYAGSPRFLFPAAGLVSVLAGLGVASLLRAAGGGLRAAALALVLLAGATPFVIDRVRADEHELKGVGLRVSLEDGLERAVERAGRKRVLAAGRPTAPGQLRDQLAWELGVGLRDVGGARPPLVVFVGPRSKLTGSPPPARMPGARSVPLASVGGWDVIALEPAGG
jgi:hypothetical protein